MPSLSDSLRFAARGARRKFRDVCGLYVLTKDSKTRVLVADFDKAGWEQEARMYCGACEKNLEIL